jgi:hypothetical protein
MADRAIVKRKQVLVRRVVLVDQELVGEIEAQPAERVMVTGGCEM